MSAGSARSMHYDSANIAESYAGIVLPLTCSFASMVYEEVYKDLLAASGVPRKKIEAHRTIFANLLAFFYGRMYYCMNNWYRMAEFAPGYTRNKRNFELMITSNARADVDTALAPSPLYALLYPFIIAYKATRFDAVCRAFTERTTQHLRTLRALDWNTQTYADCLRLFASFNENLLRRWYITVENDFFVMTYMGVLEKRLGKEELQKRIVFPSRATQQVDALADLARLASTHADLWGTVWSRDVKGFARELGKHPEIKAALYSYMDTFGGRFANELKLESAGADEDTGKLLGLLWAYKGYARTEPAAAALAPLRSFVARRALAGFRKHAARREEFRLLRSNTFSMARRLFRRMGALLAESGALEHADDVFYLTLEELLREDAPSDTVLRAAVAKRKEEYASYALVEPPAHFSTTDGTVPLASSAEPTEVRHIQANPASAGVLEGTVRIFKEFSLPKTIDFDILVTSHTDPGWTALIALSKGLIIEHGGVLSHASIVARELGIPAVIGATDAMRTLKDGERVRINGATGLVERLP